ncbi:MAG: CPBP family glutamic-type intramembrane protease, partial [Polyangiaceae bacterium]|nr:CPBP family glutamic-type intramembrane protease [Polyangiaceae bacterium]
IFLGAGFWGTFGTVERGTPSPGLSENEAAENKAAENKAAENKATESKTNLERAREDAVLRASGLSFGGLFERTPLQPKKLISRFLSSLIWSGVILAIIALPYSWAFRYWHQIPGTFDFARAFAIEPIAGLGLSLPAWSFIEIALMHLIVIALPEEVFFRGYLQKQLSRQFSWQRRLPLLGGALTSAQIIASLLFALGHFATNLQPHRLAVFFPSLLFGWVFDRRRSVFTSALVHAGCNLLVIILVQGYGLA